MRSPSLATAAVVGEGDAEFVLLLGAAWVSGVVLGERTGDVAALRSSHAALVARARRGGRPRRRRGTDAHRRELHDVVAHRVSLMVVQAQGAEAVLDVDPSRARVAMVEVQDAGRTALAELRSLLGLLRDESEGGDASRAPQPGLDDLEELLGSTHGGRGRGVAGARRHRRRPGGRGRRCLPCRPGGGHQRDQHGAGSPATVRVHVHDATVEVTVEATAGPGIGHHSVVRLRPRRDAGADGLRRRGPSPRARERRAASACMPVIPLAPDRAEPVIRVVVVDDERLVLDGIEAVLSVEADLEVVGLAADGQAGRSPW